MKINLNFLKNKVNKNWRFNIPSLSLFKKKAHHTTGDFLAKRPVSIEGANVKIVNHHIKKGSNLTKTSVSFEGTSVKIVTAHIKKGRIFVKNAITIGIREFPDFLKMDKSNEYYVTFSPPSFYSDTITIPKVKSTQYIKPLLKNRLKDVKGASASFDVVFKDIPAKGKDNKTLDLFTIAVDTKEISDIMSLFSKAKKGVKFLHTHFNSILPFISTIGKTVVGIVRAGNYAYIIFVKDSSPVFVKKFELGGDGFSDIDTMQINMTINYIAQTYQEMPSGIYLFSYSGNDTVPIGNISIPISLFDPVSKVQNLPPDIAMEYILPLGALLSDRQFDLLPEVYSTGRVVKSIARNAGVSFLAIGIIMGLHLGLSYKEVSDIKARVLSIRGQATPDIGSAINYMSSLTSMPIKEKIDLSGAEEFLVNLSNLVPPEIELENFKIIPTGGKWEIQMEGTSAIGNNAYTVIGMFVAQIKSIENMNVTESSMSVSEKTIKFTIKANHV